MSNDDVVGVCTECKTDQPDSYLMNSPFGDQAPCKYCGGVIVVTYKNRRKQTLQTFDNRRGIGHADSD